MSMYQTRSWLLVLIVVVAAMTGAWLLKPIFSQPTPLTLKGGQLYPQPKALAPFSLIDQNGKPFANQQLQGKWTFIFFGYTTCPDICPTTLAVFTQLYKQLPGNLQADTQLLFATVDPERDTPEKLYQYLPFFHPSLQGVTGDIAATGAFARELGVAYAKVEQQGGGYLVDHSVRVFLLNDKGERYALFAPTMGSAFDATIVRRDYLRIRGVELEQ